MSARSGSGQAGVNGFPYLGGLQGAGPSAFTCPFAATPANDQTYTCGTSFGGGAAVTYGPGAFTVPATGLWATIPLGTVNIGTRDPIRLNTFSFPIISTSAPTKFELYFVSTSENGGNQMAPMRINFPTLAAGAGPTGGLYTVTFDFRRIGPGCQVATPAAPCQGVELGRTWSGTIQIFATPGVVISDPMAPVGSPATLPSCFSAAVGTEVQATMTFERGGALGFVSAMSGTSMSGPLLAGTGALAREYFTAGAYSFFVRCVCILHALHPPPLSPPPPLAPAGFFPSGSRTATAGAAGAGFVPTAALLKAALMNSATPLVGEKFNNYFNLPPLLRWQEIAQGGNGIPDIVRGFSFSTIGAGAQQLTRAAGQLTTMLLPGITLGAVVPGTAPPLPQGVDPSLAPGVTHTYCVTVCLQAAAPAVPPAGYNLPLLMTLAWTDPPALPGAVPTLVNNLDLIVTPPTGAPVAYGNTVDSAQVTPPQVPDVLNNVEFIAYPAPLARSAVPYTVQVRGTTVPVGSPQSYSLVVTGPGVQLSPAVAGTCPAYTCIY